MIVVDANVLVYLESPGPQTDLVAQVYARDSEWAAPPLWRSEFRNALAGAIRTAGLSVALAMTAFEEASAKLGAREIAPPSAMVFQLIGETRLTAYDLEYVALARSLGAPLVTYDRQILQAFEGLAVHPADYLASA